MGSAEMICFFQFHLKLKVNNLGRLMEQNYSCTALLSYVKQFLNSRTGRLQIVDELALPVYSVFRKRKSSRR